MSVIDPWTPGVKLLVAQSIREERARSIIGKWVTQFGRARVLKAVEKAAEIGPANAQEYIRGVLNGGDGPKRWSDEWIDQEFRAGRIQIRAGESYADVRKRMR